ncbi:MAG: bacillithiol biosynthesis deacetylase BshB2 [Alicyclobacillus sp.]|nr:bacillithiol biosynthesis deacetylase BshB2 [Alicyclobacillus sp.]
MGERVVAIYPHPDDETFGKGGALALHVKQGDTVTVVCATLGQMGRNMGKPFFANRESMPDIRRKELDAACHALGVTDVRLLGLHDKTIEFEDPERVAGMIFNIVQELRPTRVYTYYPGHGVHPDHDALARATIQAIRKLPPDQRPVVYASAITRNRIEACGEPDVVLDVSSVFAEKIAAMKAHRSQSEASMKRMEADIEAHPERKEEIEAPFKTERYWIYQVS